MTQNNKVNKKKPLPKSFLNTADLFRTAPLPLCNHWRRKGRAESSGLIKMKYDYYFRQGHSIQDCHTRLAEER